MIRGVHAMLYTADPEATRAFLRDRLGLPCTDVGGGWLIFDVAEAEVGCHPLDRQGAPPTMDFSLYCDDIEATVAELTAKGVAFAGGAEDRGWGLATQILVPGGPTLLLYQPRYAKG